jgi:hypothetical protein
MLASSLTKQKTALVEAAGRTKVVVASAVDFDTCNWLEAVVRVIGVPEVTTVADPT